MRDAWRHSIAEFIGTFALVFVGSGAIMVAKQTGSSAGLIEVAMAHGLILAVMVTALMKISGHFNPAITIGFIATRRIEPMMGALYIVSQIIGGAKQTCDFDAGLYFHPGPMRIPADHLTTLNYCKEFNLALEAFLNVNENAYYHTAKPEFQQLGGGKLRHREAKADMFGYTDELMAKVTSQGALDKELSKDDRDALMQFFSSDGWLGAPVAPASNADLSRDRGSPIYGPNMRRGYSVLPGGADHPGELSKPVDRHTLFQSKVFFGFGYEQYIDFQMTMLQIAGGTDLLAKAFADRVGQLITYNAPIQEIRKDGSGVRVVYRRPDGTMTETKSE